MKKHKTARLDEIICFSRTLIFPTKYSDLELGDYSFKFFQAVEEQNEELRAQIAVLEDKILKQDQQLNIQKQERHKLAMDLDYERRHEDCKTNQVSTSVNKEFELRSGYLLWPGKSSGGGQTHLGYYTVVIAFVSLMQIAMLFS